MHFSIQIRRKLGADKPAELPGAARWSNMEAQDDGLADWVLCSQAAKAFDSCPIQFQGHLKMSNIPTMHLPCDG